MFIGYTQYSAACRFLVIRSDNNGMKMTTKKYKILWACFFSLKTHEGKLSLASSFSHVQESDDNAEIELRGSKRAKKETEFRKDFFTFLADDDLLTYREAVSSPNALFWKETINNELEFILSNHT